jgi:hypothetical protein
VRVGDDDQGVGILHVHASRLTYTLHVGKWPWVGDAVSVACRIWVR